MAKVIGCHQDTLSKVFKILDIPFKKFPKENKVLCNVTKESLEKELQSLPIKKVAILHNVHPGQLVAKMKEFNIERARNKPHRRNQSILSIPDPIFKELVEYQGILDLARELSCSQSTIRDRAKKLSIVLVAGPHKALTSTETWKRLQQQNALKGAAGSCNKNTSIEIVVQEYLKSKGVAFDLHPKILGLTVPDLFVAPNICIYVDGCYWHGCPVCKVSDKNSGLTYTKTHDNFVNKQLLKNNYRTVRIWEHSIKAGDFSALDFLIE